MASSKSTLTPEFKAARSALINQFGAMVEKDKPLDLKTYAILPEPIVSPIGSAKVDTYEKPVFYKTTLQKTMHGGHYGLSVWLGSVNIPIVIFVGPAPKKWSTFKLTDHETQLIHISSNPVDMLVYPYWQHVRNYVLCNQLHKYPRAIIGVPRLNNHGLIPLRLGHYTEKGIEKYAIKAFLYGLGWFHLESGPR